MDEARPAQQHHEEHPGEPAGSPFREGDSDRYRDFAAARRAFRAGQRHRSAEEQRESELRSAEQKQAAARGIMQRARAALEEVLQRSPAANSQARREAEEELRRAEALAMQQTEEAHWHTEAAETLRVAVETAQREAAEARREAHSYTGVTSSPRRGQWPEAAEAETHPPADGDASAAQREEARRREARQREERRREQQSQAAEFAANLAMSRPATVWAGASDRYTSGVMSVAAESLRAYREQRHAEAALQAAGEENGDVQEGTGRLSPLRYDADDAAEGAARLLIPRAPVRMAGRDDPADQERYIRMRRNPGGDAPPPMGDGEGADRVPLRSGYRDERIREGHKFLDRRARPRELPATPPPAEAEVESSAPAAPVAPPAWLNVEAAAPPARREAAAAAPEPRDARASAVPHTPAAPAATAPDSLEQSREMVAARWYALSGMLGTAQPRAATENAPATGRERQISPMLTVVSLAGGVGKTSLVATLGRALASLGERVLLVESVRLGLLPYYFGARALRAGSLRTFAPPPGSPDAPVQMLNLPVEESVEAERRSAMLDAALQQASSVERILLDLDSSGTALALSAASRGSSVLIPLSADMNSVIGLQRTEEMFAGAVDEEGRPVRPWYVLNQFDSSLPLHLDVREVLRQQLGDRLLSLAIRRSPAVAEALAEGMTVMDYAPGSPVATDFLGVAAWLRNLAAPAHSRARGARWSER